MLTALIVIGYALAAVVVGALTWVGSRQADNSVARSVFWTVWMGVLWPGTVVLFVVWLVRRRHRRSRLRVIQSDQT